MNAKLLITIVTLVVAISTVIVLTVGGADKDGDGVLDHFTMKGALTCDGCSWVDTDGVSSTVFVELAVTTLGTASIELHASYGMHHWYMIDETWYTTVEPEGDDWSYAGETITADTAPWQLSCNKAGWDGEWFEGDFSVSVDGDSATIETMFGPISIAFVDGAPKTLTADYVPSKQTSAVFQATGQYQKAKLTMDVIEFTTTDAGIEKPSTLVFDDSNCVESSVSSERRTKMQRRRLSHLSPEEKAKIFTQEIEEMDLAAKAEIEKYEHLGEAASLAMQMDRKLSGYTHEEEILQAAIGVYNYVGDIPTAMCSVQNTDGVDYGFENGYSLMARGGYEEDSTARPTGWTDSHSPQHSMICYKGSKCVFAWRGSTVLENWINNVDFFKTDIEGKVAGTTREVHGGFYREMEYGIKAKNSYGQGAATVGETLEEIWRKMDTLSTCTERYYTGHSLGGACAAVGHWYFEEGSATKLSNNPGSGRAYTFAAPQPWRSVTQGISEDPMCYNKRFYLETTYGNDPVPGLPGILLSSFNGLFFDHADNAFPFWWKYTCSTSDVGEWRKKCGWGICVSYWWPTGITEMCKTEYSMENRGCDDETGGGSNPIYHLSSHYINNFHESAIRVNPAATGYGYNAFS